MSSKKQKLTISSQAESKSISQFFSVGSASKEPAAGNEKYFEVVSGKESELQLVPAEPPSASSGSADAANKIKKPSKKGGGAAKPKAKIKAAAKKAAAKAKNA